MPNTSASSPQYKGRMVLIYAHKDRQFLKKSTFIDFLKGAATELGFDFWWDERMTQGSWEDEIKYQLQNADVIICLVSQPFLNSSFVLNVESKITAQRHSAEGLIVIPVMYQASLWESHGWLKKLHHLPADSSRPYLHGRSDQVMVFKEVSDHILKRVKGRGATFREPRSLYTLRRLPDTAFTEEEAKRLLQDARTRANQFVPSQQLQEQIRREAKGRGASVETPLSKRELEKLDELFLARQQRRKPDPKKIRWVLRAGGLHPQGRTPKSPSQGDNDN